MGSERRERHPLGGEGIRRIGDDSVVGILNGGREDGGVQVELKLPGRRGIKPGAGQMRSEMVGRDLLVGVGVREVGNQKMIAGCHTGNGRQVVDVERQVDIARSGPAGQAAVIRRVDGGDVARAEPVRAIGPGRARLSGRAPQPRADADKAQLAAVRVERILVVRIADHRLDREAVARHAHDAIKHDDQAVFRRAGIPQIGARAAPDDGIIAVVLDFDERRGPVSVGRIDGFELE